MITRDITAYTENSNSIYKDYELKISVNKRNGATTSITLSGNNGLDILSAVYQQDGKITISAPFDTDFKDFSESVSVLFNNIIDEDNRSE